MNAVILFLLHKAENPDDPDKNLFRNHDSECEKVLKSDQKLITPHKNHNIRNQQHSTQIVCYLGR
jgi:hypothetical protein